MSHGGVRMGQGRKKSRPALMPVPGGRPELADPPADVAGVAAAFWATYARYAVEGGILTDATVAAWRLMCELEAERVATKQTIDADGRTCIKVVIDGAGNEIRELKAHPLTSSYARLGKQVEMLMARFCLAPFGKPIATAKPKAATVNPWASIVTGRS